MENSINCNTELYSTFLCHEINLNAIIKMLFETS